MQNKDLKTSSVVKGTSTSSTGPAGAHFEGQVGGFYLLALLCGTPPRGLPSTLIERVALQQANEGRHLDDVIIHANTLGGHPAVLEIQVKRDITFAPKDPVFKKVVGQICKASQHINFDKQRYELAVATGKGSKKIDGAYQEVLTLARQVENANSFFSKLDLIGAANDDMRTFVNTFRNHIGAEGFTNDNESIWRLLKRLQILHFDFLATGSVSEDLVRERAVNILHPDDISRVESFWRVLIELSLEIAKSGGEQSKQSLLENLATKGFRFREDRRFANALNSLSESSQLALADINDTIGHVTLFRQKLLIKVCELLENNRYLEIRGDVGVGKSAILKHLAEKHKREGRVIVLSPRRCPPGGWPAFRSQISFDGSLKELLVEFGNEGGVTIFIDGLDFFTPNERVTVVDFVREAVEVSGISVVATARINFCYDEPNWLPDDAIATLGRANTIVIEELEQDDIEQLIAGDASLALLLDDSHPARQVTRNLFRLSRIARQRKQQIATRSEVEMAIDWWGSADGEHDELRRERSRLLQYAAKQSLHGKEEVNVSEHPAAAVDALIKSGCIREIKPDVIDFRHDAFREWAIAMVLHSDISLLNNLDLTQPASAGLARAIELTARMEIENAENETAWCTLLDLVSKNSFHASWRRAILLSIVRSEVSWVLLNRAMTSLLNKDTTFLREIIRNVLAVETVPAHSVLGLNASQLPSDFKALRGGAPLALIIWLIRIEEVPPNAILEIVELFSTHLLGTFGNSLLAKPIIEKIYNWLRYIEPEVVSYPSNFTSIFEALERDQAKTLRDQLRLNFLMYCHHTPELAAEYLEAIKVNKNDYNLLRSILKFSGTLAQAAPKELADLTIDALIEIQRVENIRGRRLREPFSLYDNEFLPASPAQGPFFELLIHSRKDGLRVIHKMVDHAVKWFSHGSDPDLNVIEIKFPEKTRSFPWRQTYFWSRESDGYGMTSGLMAMEAWAHRRIEAGENFDCVLADVLGPSGSPAAYLLIAVDLIISHWPKSKTMAKPFLANPELLCLDHNRQVHEVKLDFDLFGLGISTDETKGPVSLKELKRRPSRNMTLDGLIGYFSLESPEDERAELVSMLSDQAKHLGPPRPDSALNDPAFMVFHALNLADTQNWKETSIELRDGTSEVVKQYVPPNEEEQHLKPLQEAQDIKNIDFVIQQQINNLVDSDTIPSNESIDKFVEWSQQKETIKKKQIRSNEEDEFSLKETDQAILTSAFFVLRDDSEEMFINHGEWALRTVHKSIKSPNNEPAVRNGLRFNPTAIAYAGSIYALRRNFEPNNVELVLGLAASGNHAAAHGFFAAINELMVLDQRISRSILRCAFTSCIIPNYRWDRSEQERENERARFKKEAEDIVFAELRWLFEGGPEPSWPNFPKENVRLKKKLRFPSKIDTQSTPASSSLASHDSRVNYQAAALWLSAIKKLSSKDECLWLKGLIDFYRNWTLAANGAGLELFEEISNAPSEWNSVYFALMSRILDELDANITEEIIINPILDLPDQQFYDTLTDILINIDAIYFNSKNIKSSVAVAIRSAFAKRMMRSNGWRRMRGKRDESIEMHLGPAVAALFFNEHHFIQPTKCYLTKIGLKDTSPFLPILIELVQSCPSIFVALLVLNLVEVDPNKEHVDILVVGANSWLSEYQDYRLFWTNNLMFGARWCEIIRKIFLTNKELLNNKVLCADIDDIVTALIKLGVSEASDVEIMVRLDII